MSDFLALFSSPGVTPTAPPVAGFTGTPLSGAASLSVAFTDTSTHTPTSWLWEKNDGSGWVSFAGTPTVQNPTEVFAAGIWSVRVTVSNASLVSSTSTRTDYLTSSVTTITSFPVGSASGQKPTVYVGDVGNGFNLYTLNADTQTQYPGSVIKLMTLLLAWEYKSAVWTSDTVTITAADVTDPIGGSTSAGFLANDIVTWEGLAYGLLLPSGFDACQAIARVIGNEIYAAAGNTGTQGMTRFIETMNARGVTLGLTNSTFTDAWGGSKTLGPTVVRNVTSARDMATIGKEVFKASHTALRAMAGAATHGVAVTGASPRTITMTNFSRFVNGPTATQAGISDPSVVGSKNGTWVLSGDGIFQYGVVTIWTSPAGRELIIVTLGSKSLVGAMLDQRGLMAMAPRDFSYLASGSAGTDSAWANVKVLIGGDGSIVDESTVGRAVTLTSVTVGTAVVASSTGSMLLDATSDRATVADAADISVGAGSMTVEAWYAGGGTEPGGEAILFCKWDHTNNNKEWLIERGGAGGLDLYVSANGSAASSTTVLATGSEVGQVLWNGAPRHVAIVKNGSTWAAYIDGERMANTITAAAAFDGTAPISVGYPPSAVSAVGQYDEFRVTIGTARYTAAMVFPQMRKFPRS